MLRFGLPGPGTAHEPGYFPAHFAGQGFFFVVLIGQIFLLAHDKIAVAATHTQITVFICGTEFNHPGGNVLYKASVMADQHKREGRLAQKFFQEEYTG